MKSTAFFLAAFAAFSSLFAQNEKAATGAKPLQIPQSAFDKGAFRIIKALKFLI